MYVGELEIECVVVEVEEAVESEEALESEDVGEIEDIIQMPSVQSYEKIVTSAFYNIVRYDDCLLNQ